MKWTNNFTLILPKFYLNFSFDGDTYRYNRLRNKNNIACQRYRVNKKKETQRDEQLATKNVYLENKVMTLEKENELLRNLLIEMGKTPNM